mgnify:CR=1 FL=1
MAWAPKSESLTTSWIVILPTNIPINHLHVANSENSALNTNTSKPTLPSFKGKFLEDIEKLKGLLLTNQSTNSKLLKKEETQSGDFSNLLSNFIQNNLTNLENEIFSFEAM